MLPSASPPPAYDSWAHVFDLTDAERSPFVHFYQGLVTPRTRSALDVGCGTGTITVSVASAIGRHHAGPTLVVGLDQSGRMLAVAQQRDPSVQWVRADMRALPFRGPFDLVISSFNTMQHLLGDGELESVARGVEALLSERGIFAFDIYQPNLDYLTTPATDRLARSVIDARGQDLQLREDLRFDSCTRILTVDWRLVRSRAPTKPLASTRYHLRQYVRPEVDGALREAGLVVREQYGDFDRTAFDRRSKRQILVCKRAR